MDEDNFPYEFAQEDAPGCSDDDLAALNHALGYVMQQQIYGDAEPDQAMLAWINRIKTRLLDGLRRGLRGDDLKAEGQKQ